MASKLPNAADLRAQDAAHLTETLQETVKSLFDIRFRTSSGDKTNTATEAKQLRRQIARIKTIQHQRDQKTS